MVLRARRTLLRAAGHDVYTPTHTGVGERSHLNDYRITLSTHVRDVINMIEYEDLSDVIMLRPFLRRHGDHRRRRRARRADPVAGLSRRVPAGGRSVAVRSARAGDGQPIPRPGEIDPWPDPADPRGAFNVNAKDAAWVDKTCVPQSLLTFTEGVRFTGKEAAIPHRTYILATGYDMHVFDQFYERVKNNPKWKAHAVPCGHDVMVDRPEDLAMLLLEEVGR